MSRPHRRTGRPWRLGHPYRRPLKWHQYFLIRVILLAAAMSIVGAMCGTPR
jgi:hypothetical protein